MFVIAENIPVVFGIFRTTFMVVVVVVPIMLVLGLGPELVVDLNKIGLKAMVVECLKLLQDPLQLALLSSTQGRLFIPNRPSCPVQVADLSSSFFFGHTTHLGHKHTLPIRSSAHVLGVVIIIRSLGRFEPVHAVDGEFFACLFGGEPLLSDIADSDGRRFMLEDERMVVLLRWLLMTLDFRRMRSCVDDTRLHVPLPL